MLATEALPLVGSLFDIQATSYLGALYSLRILMGLFESITYPAFFALLAHWTPSSERSFNVGLGLGGAYIGTAIAFPVCSTLAATSLVVIGRWPGMFYLFGMLTVVWAVAWFAFVRKSPEDDPRVSPAELHWIVSTRKSDDKHAGVAAKRNKGNSIAGNDDGGGGTGDGGGEAVGGGGGGFGGRGGDRRGGVGEPLTVLQKCWASVWARMLLCPAAWALFAAHFASNWINYTLLVRDVRDWEWEWE